MHSVLVFFLSKLIAIFSHSHLIWTNIREMHCVLFEGLIAFVCLSAPSITGIHAKKRSSLEEAVQRLEQVVKEASKLANITEQLRDMHKSIINAPSEIPTDGDLSLKSNFPNNPDCQRNFEILKTGLNDEKILVRNEMLRIKQDLTDIQMNISILTNEVLKATQDWKSCMDVQEIKFLEHGEQLNALASQMASNFAHITSSMNKMANETEANLSDLLSKISRNFVKNCNDWTKFDNSCYFMSVEKVSWGSAKQKCIATGAYLVEIDSEEEDMFLRRMAKDYYGRNYYGPWIGASDIDNEGIWRWVHSGRAISSGYRAWDDGEPNGDTQENCGHFFAHNQRWNDLNCTRLTTYMCEY